MLDDINCDLRFSVSAGVSRCDIITTKVFPVQCLSINESLLGDLGNCLQSLHLNIILRLSPYQRSKYNQIVLLYDALSQLNHNTNDNYLELNQLQHHSPRPFNSNQQQDAHDYLHALLRDIMEFGKVHFNKNIPMDHYSYSFKKQSECPQCKLQRIEIEQKLYMTLHHFVSGKTIPELLDINYNMQQKSQDPVDCSGCNGKVFKNYTLLKPLPYEFSNNMIVQIMDIQYNTDTSTAHKIDGVKLISIYVINA